MFSHSFTKICINVKLNEIKVTLDYIIIDIEKNYVATYTSIETTNA